MTKSKRKTLKTGLWLPGQSTVIMQFPLTPVPHLLVTCEVENQGFVDRAIWVADSCEPATVLSIPAGILTLWWKTVYNSYRYIYAIDLKHKFLDGMNQEQEQKTRWDLSAVAYDYIGIQVLTCKQQHRCERSLWWLNKQLVWASAYLQCTEVFSLLFLWSRVQFFFTLFLYFLWEKATPLCSKQTAKSKTNNSKQKPTTSVVTGLLSISSIVIKILIGGGKTKNQNDLSQ